MPANRQSPNHQPATPTQNELSPEEKTVLDVSVADELRALQLQQMTAISLDPQYGIGNTRWYTDWVDGIDAEIDRFLTAKGVAPTSTNYAEIKTLLREASLDKQDNEWRIGQPNANGQGRQPSGREKFAEDVRLRIEQSDAITRAVAGVPDLATLEQLQEEAGEMNFEFDSTYAELENARELWAEASAKMQGRVFSMKDADRDALKADYDQKLRQFGILYLGHNIDSDHPNYNEADANRRVIKFLFAEQELLRESTTEKLKSTKTSKFVEWMNKGGKWKKLGKSALVGVAAAGVAGGIVLTGGLLAAGAGAGAIGSAAGAASAGAVGFGRFLRGFGRADRQRGMQTAEEAHGANGADIDHNDVNAANTEARLGRAKGIFDNEFKTDTELEQKKRRKAAMRGMTNVALGAGIGAAVTVAADHLNIGEKLANVKDAVTDKYHDVTDKDAANYGPFAPEVDSSDIDGDGVINSEDIAPRNADYAHIDFDAISQDTRFIDRGEGGFQTLKGLGVPEAKWEEVWADAGERFSESGKTYMMDDGHWGWSEPGRMSNDDITELVKAARRNGVALDYALTA